MSAPICEHGWSDADPDRCPKCERQAALRALAAEVARLTRELSEARVARLTRELSEARAALAEGERGWIAEHIHAPTLIPQAVYESETRAACDVETFGKGWRVVPVIVRRVPR